MTELEEQTKAQLKQFREDFNSLRQEIAKVIVGQEEIVKGVLTCLMAGGHALLEGVPGLGKTLLVRTLSQVLDLKFSRIQFTPDLMPADIIGTNIVVEGEGGRKYYEFQQGPIFGNVLLADEINRATPKTQSALLEAMQEKSVTVAGETRQLHPPFFVAATQNPLEMEGTYPLPEAQLDRFLFKLKVEYPNLDELDEIIKRTTKREMPTAEVVCDGNRINEMSTLIRDVEVSEDVQKYALQIVLATHPYSEIATELTKKYIRYGSSPRGAQAMILAGKIRALLDEDVRYVISRDDLRKVALPGLRHRIILNFEGEAEGIEADEIIQNILEEVE